MRHRDGTPRHARLGGTLEAMTATFDHLDLRDLVPLLTNSEQEALRAVALQFVHTREQSASEANPDARPSSDAADFRRHRRLSFAGIGHAGPNVAEQSREILRRELGGSNE